MIHHLSLSLFAARLLGLQEELLLSVFCAAGEPAALRHLPPAVGHGLPAAQVNATPR